MRTVGRCHCGNIRFELDWHAEPREILARECGCSFCRKHGGVWTSAPGGSLAVTIAQPARASVYAFGTRTADFHVCADCGVVPLVTSRIDGRLYAVVNVNSFENVDPARLRRLPVAFDGESQPERLARRKLYWIGEVRFEPLPA